MNSKLELSVIIPAYLEEENLRLLLPRLNETLSCLNISYEIIVVDTMTPLDNSRQVCQLPQVVYINRVGANTFGAAVRAGISIASGAYLLFMDGDGSHESEFIPHLLEYRKTYDLVVASRYIAGGATENPRAQILMSKILNLTYSLVLGIKCKDISNSFKLYRGELLRPLSLKANNFNIIEEMLFKIHRNNKSLRIKEVPFVFKKRLFGKTKRNLLLFILTYLLSLVQLRLSIYFDK